MKKPFGRPKKKLRGMPKDELALLAEIRTNALHKILNRLRKGCSLKASEYAFIQNCERDKEQKAVPKKTIELRPLTYFQKLGEAQDISLAALLDEVRNGKGISRSSAARILLDKGRQEAPPKSGKVVVRFNPIGEEADVG